MKWLTQLGALALLVLGAFGMLPGGARADLIQIDDLLDGNPVVTVRDNPGGLTITAIGPESVSFNFASSRVNTVSTQTAYVDLLDPGGSTTSDRFIITATSGSNILNVTFGSDPLLPAIPPNGVNAGPLTEDGTFQQVIQYFGGSTTAIDTFQVRSDIESGDLPEPSSLALLGIGGLGMAGACWRQRRARAASR
jgi:hypothetical protein